MDREKRSRTCIFGISLAAWAARRSSSGPDELKRLPGSEIRKVALADLLLARTGHAGQGSVLESRHFASAVDGGRRMGTGYEFGDASGFAEKK